jgi:probable O-glycosylation ligase (exosortase A-associated)
VRDQIILAVIYAVIPLIVFRPYLGLLTYAWLAYMRPQDMAWGVTKMLPLSQWVAIAMMLGLVLSLGRERWMVLRPQTGLLLGLWGWISLSRINALIPEMARYTYGQYWKAILIATLTTGLVRDRKRFRILLILTAFCLGFLGAKRGLFGLLRGGVRYNDGPGGFMSDNNSFALVLNMTLPLLVGIAIAERERILRVVAAVMAALSVLTIFFTFSRGGLVTFCIVGPMLIWRSRRRWLIAALLVLGVAGFLVFASDSFTSDYLERASTIDDYQEDSSALGRINAWVTSWRVFLDYPLFGVGPNNLAAVFFRYSPAQDRFRVAHNAYFQLLAECGLPALLLFLSALGVSLWRLDRLRRASWAPAWAEVYARMLQISIIAYMAGSMFLNTAYSELIYHLIALSVCLEVIAHQETAEAAVTPTPAMAETSAAKGEAAGLPWWKRPLPQPSLSGRG